MFELIAELLGDLIGDVLWEWVLRPVLMFLLVRPIRWLVVRPVRRRLANRRFRRTLEAHRTAAKSPSQLRR